MQFQEQHILIDWKNIFSKEEIKKILINRNLSLIKFKQFKIPAKKVKSTMVKFYNLEPYQWYENDKRGKKQFNIYIILDKYPIYRERTTSKGFRYVNIKMFDLKKDLRMSIGPKNCLIHASDNIQETKDNLRVLGLFKELYKERSFRSLESVFETLNKINKFRWLILRNFENLPNDYYSPDHGDIDLLVDNFFITKAALDSEAVSSFNRFEDGGERVLQSVLINNERVLFDFRFLGDNYYDSNWQSDLLLNRKEQKMFYIPSNRDFKYSILYHAIVHKGMISENYINILFSFFKTTKRSDLLNILKEFMMENNYLFTKPESSVGFFPWKLKNKIIKKITLHLKKINKITKKYKNYFVLKIKYFFRNLRDFNT